MGRYIGTAQLGTYLNQAIPFAGTFGSAQQQLFSDCIDRAEAAIDIYTRRIFVGTPGTVYMNRFEQTQVAASALYLDQDLHTLVSITNGDTQVIPVGSVWLEPRNQGPPYRIIRLKSSYVWNWNTDADVTIAGTFGYSTVAPADIQQATVRYAAHLYRAKDSQDPTNTSGWPEGGEQQIPQGMPSDVRYILSPYRSKTGGAV